MRQLAITRGTPSDAKCDGVCANSLALQADGKIVAAGSYGGDFALARFNADGSLDSSFSGDGKQTSDIGWTNDSAHGVRIQSDGKIVAAGTSAGDMAVARYDTSGTLDTTFDTDGYLTVDMGSVEIGNALWIGPDYKNTVAGRYAKFES